MKQRIGFIGVGHLAEYLITGLARSGRAFEFYLADPYPRRAEKLIARYGGVATMENRQVVEDSEMIVLCTRPDDIGPALENISFRKDQLLISVAAGVPLSRLLTLAEPATVVRALPVSCAAVNRSPTLLYPENTLARDLFELVGQVHALSDESLFAPATALVGAYYAWIFALMDATTSWACTQGIKAELARDLVIETIQGACCMAKDQADMTLSAIWDTLATPGGISEYGIRFISEPGGLKVWAEALSAVTQRIRKA